MQNQTKPNILYIMADDHSLKAISAYQSRLRTVMETPNIDRIATEGVRLNNCCCTNAICTPSRASILTGQYSHMNNVRTLSDKLDENSDTFVTRLHNSGYNTALFGKWHLHGEPKGFDDYFIFPGQGQYFNPYFVKKGEEEWKSKVEPKAEEDESLLVDELVTRAHYPKGKSVEGYSTDIITDNCIEWLESRNTDSPFLLMCHFKAPHDDFEYHPRYEHIFDDVEIPEPESLWENKSHRSDGSKNFGTTVSEKNMRRNAVKTMSDPDYPTGQLDVENLNSDQRTKAAYQKYLKDYLRVVKGIDDNVGRLLQTLERLNLDENTLVIYTSDQGMFLGEHDYIDKRWIYEEALKMPFVASFPGRIPQGLVLDNVISNVDFADTLLDFADLSGLEQSQGRSFKPLLLGDNISDWADISYNRYWMHMAHHDNPAHYGIRTRRYKLIYFYGLPLDASDAEPYPTPTGWELYDLERDPDEVQNLYNHKDYQDVVAEMKVLLKEFKDQIGDSDSRYPELVRQKENLYHENNLQLTE